MNPLELRAFPQQRFHQIFLCRPTEDYIGTGGCTREVLKLIAFCDADARGHLIHERYRRLIATSDE